MARKARVPSPTGIYHWIVRGIHKKHIFHSEDDFGFFKSLLRQYGPASGIAIYHYCLMGNHVHLLIHAADSVEPMIRFSTTVLRKYAYHYSRTYGWIGSVFQRGYKSLPVDRELYLLECARYIERNPVKAGLAAEPAEHPHSSFLFYKNAKADGIVTPSPAFLGLDEKDEVRRKMYANYVEATRVQEHTLVKINKTLLTPPLLGKRGGRPPTKKR